MCLTITRHLFTCAKGRQGVWGRRWLAVLEIGGGQGPLEEPGEGCQPLALTHLQLQRGLPILHHTGQVQVVFLDAQGHWDLVTILFWHEAHAEHH